MEDLTLHNNTIPFPNQLLLHVQLQTDSTVSAEEAAHSGSLGPPSTQDAFRFRIECAGHLRFGSAHRQTFSPWMHEKSRLKTSSTHTSVLLKTMFFLLCSKKILSAWKCKNTVEASLKLYRPIRSLIQNRWRWWNVCVTAVLDYRAANLWNLCSSVQFKNNFTFMCQHTKSLLARLEPALFWPHVPLHKQTLMLTKEILAHTNSVLLSTLKTEFSKRSVFSNLNHSLCVDERP